MGEGFTTRMFHIFCLDINEYTHIVTKIFRVFNIHSRFLLNDNCEFWARTLNCALQQLQLTH